MTVRDVTPQVDNPPPAPASALEQALFAEVERAFESDQVPRLIEWVDQPSHTYATADVERMQERIDQLATEMGLRVQKRPDPDGRFAAHRVYQPPHVDDSSPALALVGHADTVFPREMNFLSSRRDGDTLYGPGALDMKSGLTSMFFALRALQRVSPELYRKIKVRLVCVSDEEVGSPSSASLYRALAPTTTSALVFEAGRIEDRIVVARKGAAGIRIRATGHAAHSGNRHAEGVNAILALSLLIPQIESMTDYERGITLNVGLCEGGSAKNTVPAQASCMVDIRFERHSDGVRTIERLQSLVESPFVDASHDAAFQALPPWLQERMQQAEFKLEGGISRPPMEATRANDELRLSYEPFAQRAGIQIGAAPLQGGGSDANLLAAAGVPCIDGLGPFGKHFHKVEEWSSLDSLLRRTQALTAFLAAQASAQSTHP